MNEDFFHSLYGMMIVHQYEFECFYLVACVNRTLSNLNSHWCYFLLSLLFFLTGAYMF
jgi:hypothetical protein